jgi:hypothetical protein
VTFWDYANNHSADAVLITLFVTVAVVRVVAWTACGIVNLTRERRKRDARDAREGGQTFPRTGAGGQA